MAVNSMTYNFDSILSTSLMNYRKTMYEQIFNAIPFFYWLHANGRKRVEDGGERIVIPLMYAKNSTIKSMKGYDIVDTTPQDEITAAYYEWKEIAGSITISNRELVQNSGKNKVIDLLKAKTTNAEMSMSEKVEQMVLAFSEGNGGKDLLPLYKLIQKTPTGTDTVGGIAQQTYAWWRNQIKSSSATTWAAFIKEMGNLYNSCSKGGAAGKRSAPDMILCDQMYYETYEAACRDKTRIYNEKVADLGFGGLKFRGCTLLWDEYVPSVQDGVAVTDPDSYWDSYSVSTGTFINSDFIEFVIARGNDFTIGPFIQPENQKAKTSIIYMMGEVCCSNRRKQGVHYNVSQAIAA